MNITETLPADGRMETVEKKAEAWQLITSDTTLVKACEMNITETHPANERVGKEAEHRVKAWKMNIAHAPPYPNLTLTLSLSLTLSLPHDRAGCIAASPGVGRLPGLRPFVLPTPRLALHNVSDGQSMRICFNIHTVVES